MVELGQRLKSARVKVNLTISEVSQRTGIGESSLSDFENGKREPKISQLARLGDAYRRSLTFFLDDVHGDERPVLWRSGPEAPSPLLEREFLKLCEQYRLLEEWNNDFIAPLLPCVEAGRHALGFEDVAELARRVGGELNLGERPAFVLLRVLEEECGIKIFHRDFEPTAAVACVKSEQNGWAILLNAGNSEACRNLDLARELFHLLVWDLFRGAHVGACGISPEQEETLANAFAACLLIPAEALRRMVERKRSPEGKVAVSDIAEVARQFGVPFEALLWRLHRVYHFGPSREAEADQILRAVQNGTATRQIADAVGRKPPPLPDRYRRLAIRALRKGEISLGKFMEFMQMSRREALKYQETEEYALGEIQLTPA